MLGLLQIVLILVVIKVIDFYCVFHDSPIAHHPFLRLLRIIELTLRKVAVVVSQAILSFFSSSAMSTFMALTNNEKYHLENHYVY